MKAKKPRRAGATETIGISIDPETKRRLKDLALERHRGNVSALIAELTEAAVRQAAFERAWRWYGGAVPSREASARIDAEMEEGWALARKTVRKPRRKKAA